MSEINDRDVFATARVIMKRYGDDALAEAERRAVRFDQRGDAKGHALWRRVRAAIEAMQETEPEGDAN